MASSANWHADFRVTADYDGVVSLEHDRRRIVDGRLTGDAFLCHGAEIVLPHHFWREPTLKTIIAIASRHRQECPLMKTYPGLCLHCTGNIVWTTPSPEWDTDNFTPKTCQACYDTVQTQYIDQPCGNGPCTHTVNTTA